MQLLNRPIRYGFLVPSENEEQAHRCRTPGLIDKCGNTGLTLVTF